MKCAKSTQARLAWIEVLGSSQEEAVMSLVTKVQAARNGEPVADMPTLIREFEHAVVAPRRAKIATVGSEQLAPVVPVCSSDRPEPVASLSKRWDQTRLDSTFGRDDELEQGELDLKNIVTKYLTRSRPAASELIALSNDRDYPALTERQADLEISRLTATYVEPSSTPTSSPAPASARVADDTDAVNIAAEVQRLKSAYPHMFDGTRSSR